ncbi:MAG: WxcM-like domain-containing protein [Nitrosopumilaceae archaeon]
MEITKIKPAFIDERGSIWDLLTNDNIHHIGLLISKKGSIRGKHYHKKQKQYTLVLNGKVRIAVKDLLQTNSKLEIIDLQKMEMILLPPFHYHSIEALEDSECLIFTSKSRVGGGYENDTFRISDIESFKPVEK